MGADSETHGPRALSRPSLGAVADAVGHSVLVFAFLPVLAPFPRWLAFELANPLNRTDAVVLAYLPVRGAVLFLNVFWEGLAPGLVAGVLNGALFAFALTRADRPPAIRRALALGAAAGLAAATAMIALFVATGFSKAAQLTEPVTLFELTSGLVCGTLAAPKSARYLRGHRSLTPPLSAGSVWP